MKILISPAKTLDLDQTVPINKHSDILFKSQSVRINKVLRKKSVKALMKLMDISENLAELNYNRNQNFKEDFNLYNSKQAIYTFSGEVYVGLDAYTLNESHIDQLQSDLRILSGLYGLLRPLDLIQPYRLEMGTKLAIGTKKDLYEFWQKTITKELIGELEKDEPLVNLASNEYAHAVDFKKIKNPIITPVFKDFSNGEYKTLSFFAKKARGLMVRYIAENKISDAEQLKGFTTEGYQFDAKLSNDSKWLFLR